MKARTIKLRQHRRQKTLLHLWSHNLFRMFLWTLNLLHHQQKILLHLWSFKMHQLCHSCSMLQQALRWSVDDVDGVPGSRSPNLVSRGHLHPPPGLGGLACCPESFDDVAVREHPARKQQQQKLRAFLANQLMGPKASTARRPKSTEQAERSSTTRPRRR